MVPIHPQPCPDQPDLLRWVTPAGVLPFAGRVRVAPEPLRALLHEGALAEVLAEPAAVVTRLGAGRSWAVEGPRVRTALHAALAEPDGWAPAEGPSEPGERPLEGPRDSVAEARSGCAGHVCVGCPAARSTGFLSRLLVR